MSKINIYLAGPIAGQTVEQANNWRNWMEENLAKHDMQGVSPLRCEPIIGEVYGHEYDDNRFGHPQVIAAKNKEDVRRCDLTFAYLPGEHPASVGTLQEIGWAAGLGKPIILVTDNDYVLNNAVIKATVPWRFTATEGGFNKAMDVITGIFGVYA